MEWTEPPAWTSNKKILYSDVNNQETNTYHLKEVPCDSFCFMGQVGTDAIPLVAQQSVHINYIVKHLPPSGKMYIRDASRYFLNASLAMQLDGFEYPRSPVLNCTWYPCPEIGHGSYNRYDIDVMKTSYWRVTRWSSPVDTSTENPKNIAGWFYEEGFGHLMVENPSSALTALIQLRFIFRNLGTEQVSVTKRDCGYFNFLITTLVEV